MSLLVNRLYKNHALFYKLLLFISTTAFIVYLFPKTGKFKYSFEKGKPWQSENLLAPFDFAIKKTQEELKVEEEQIKASSTLYFNSDEKVKNKVFKAFDYTYKKKFTDSLKHKHKNSKAYAKGKAFLKMLYTNGYLDAKYNFADERPVILISSSNTVVSQLFYGDFIPYDTVSDNAKAYFNNYLSELDSNKMLSLFFDILEPNVSYNANLSEKVLTEALSQISKTRGSIKKNQLIITKGQVVEDEEFKILNSLRLEYESQVWNSASYNWVLMAYTLLVALALLMLLLFLRKYRFEVFLNNTKVTFIFFNIGLMIFLTTLIVNFNSKYIYIIPLCVLPLVLKAFFDARLGLFTHVLTVLLLGFVVPNSYEYMFLQIIAGIVTILTVSELYKRANLFISVGQITLIYILAYFAFFVIHEGHITSIKWENFGFFIFGGLATLFVQPLIYIYEKIFGLVSDVSLLELSDTNTKLLKRLSNVAPGTFHHSLNVANLAEASANTIGANAMLVRVGALYHDIGKMENPTFFSENQTNSLNPHEELSNEESAQTIINHVIKGVEIAKKYNLPDRVIDFIRTHHGTTIVYYFYMKAKATVNNENDVDINLFSYPGPKPFNKETAIVMMCDSVEAASKSLKEPTTTKINDFVESIINKQMEQGQFLNANITFKDIQLIKKVLKHKLANIFHLRVEYPE